jgi:hypothetical protein
MADGDDRKAIEMRRPLGLALLLALALSGCGKDATDPTSARTPSEERFCALYDQGRETLDLSGDADEVHSAAPMKEWGREMTALGVPADIPLEARRGMEAMLEVIEAVPARGTREEFDQVADSLSETRQSDMDAFGEYTEQTCLGP